MGSAGVIVLDERVCMVQLGIRVREFYEHESCGKCTPCREGTRWMTAILRKIEDGDATPGRARPAARRVRPHQRQVPVPARRDGGDGRRELRGEVPRGVPRARRAGRLPIRCELLARPRARARRHAHACLGRGGTRVTATAVPSLSRRQTRATEVEHFLHSSSRSRTRYVVGASAGHGWNGPVKSPNNGYETKRGRRVTAPRRSSSRSRSTSGRSRCRRGPAWSRQPRRPGSKSPSSVTSRGSGRRSAPAACASSRSRACRSCRPAAR